jgi:hypothetical protein
VLRLATPGGLETLYALNQVVPLGLELTPEGIRFVCHRHRPY